MVIDHVFIMKNLSGSQPYTGQNNIQHVSSVHMLRRIIKMRSSESKQCNQCEHKPLEGSSKVKSKCPVKKQRVVNHNG